MILSLDSTDLICSLGPNSIYSNLSTMWWKVAQIAVYISALPCPRAARPMRVELAGFQRASQSSDLPTRHQLVLFPLPLCFEMRRQNEKKTRAKSSNDVNVYLSEGFFFITAFSQNRRPRGVYHNSQLNSFAKNTFIKSIFHIIGQHVYPVFEIFPPKELIFITSSYTA